MTLTTPQKLRRALSMYATPALAAEYMELSLSRFANLCLEHGVLWPDTMVPEALGSRRKDAALAGELYRDRRAHLKEYAA